ncbi:MAG: hypothetical protein LH615_04755, partial [Ferruginibacter sp.]|nr:hypothetical protein [Ferruginibacter sp.]
MKIFFFLTLLIICDCATAQQKKPLTHNIYDGWKSVGERTISNNGAYAVYTILPQEGDGLLVIKELSTGKTNLLQRGYGAIISTDSRFVFYKIKPVFQDTRQARIKKKKPDEMPKDSFAIAILGTDSILKIALVKSFKAPQKGKDWLAYLGEKPLPDTVKRKQIPDSLKIKIDGLVKMADSIIRKSLDSVRGKIEKQEMLLAAQKAVEEIYKKATDAFTDADGDETSTDKTTEGTELTVKNLNTGKVKIFKTVSDYLFDKKGTKLLIKTTILAKDSNSKAYIILYDLLKNKPDTIMKSFADAKNFVFDEEGTQLSFVAERDSSTKALQKFYKLWYYNNTSDSTILLADKNTVGIKNNFTVSENAELKFSKDGKKLFFGTASIKPPKDTTLVDFELARLDVWNYQD